MSAKCPVLLTAEQRLEVLRTLSIGGSMTDAAACGRCRVADIEFTASNDLEFKLDLREKKHTHRRNAQQNIAYAAEDPRLWRAAAWQAFYLCPANVKRFYAARAEAMTYGRLKGKAKIEAELAAKKEQEEAKQAQQAADERLAKQHAKFLEGLANALLEGIPDAYADMIVENMRKYAERASGLRLDSDGNELPSEEEAGEGSGEAPAGNVSTERDEYVQQPPEGGTPT